MRAKHFNAFISYSRQDGVKFIDRLRQKLAEDEDGRHLKLWKDREQMEGDKDWWNQITKAIDNVEYLILIITPKALQSGTCLKEWRYAREQGVCVRPVKGVPDSEIEYQLLPKGMRDAHIYDIDQEWRKLVNDLNTTCDTNRLIFMAPPMPRNYLQRTEIFDSVKTPLLDKRIGKTIAISSALKGAGGFGKTTMATAICHDEDIKDFYHGGILWGTIGEGGNLQREATKMYNALTRREQRVFIDEEEATRHLAERLSHGKYLLVLDDIWNYRDVSSLTERLKDLNETSLLITTRVDTVVQDAGSTPFQVEGVDQEQAWRFFTAGWSIQPQHRELISDILRAMSGWLILLNLVKRAAERTLRNGESMEQTLKYIRKIYVTEGLTAFDLRNSKSRNEAIEKCIEASFSFLRDDERERCLMLGIFHPDIEVPVEAIYSLWKLDNHLGKRLLELLDDYALLELDLKKQTVQFHDVFLSFFGEKLGEGSKSSLHKKLVSSWDVSKLPHSYAWNHYIWHLKEAYEIDSAINVLRSFEWNQAKLFATDISQLLQDYEQFSLDESCHLIYRALKLSAHVLLADKFQIAAQIIGRLGYFENYAIRNLVEKARSWESPDARWLKPIKPVLQPPGYLQRILRDPFGDTHGALIHENLIINWSFHESIRVWNIASGDLLHTLKLQSGTINGALIHEDKIISWSNNATLQIWDIVSAKCLHVLEGHSDAVVGALVNRNKIISWSTDETLRIWDIVSGNCLHVLEGLSGFLTNVSIEEDKIVSWSQDKTLRLWHLSTANYMHVLEGHSDDVWGAIVKGNKIISWSADKTLRIWNSLSGNCLHILNGHLDYIWGVVIHEYRIISWSGDHTLRIWHVVTGNCLALLEGHSSSVQGASVYDDKLISWSLDNTVRIWDIVSGKCLRVLEGHSASVRGCLVTRNHIYSWAYDRSIRMWDIASGNCLHVLQSHTASIDGALLYQGQIVSWSSNGTFLLWDTASNNHLHMPERHLGYILGAAIYQAGIISWSGDETLRIWDVASGETLGVLEGHTGRVLGVEIQHDKMISWSENDQSIPIWDLSSGNCLYILHGHSGRIRRALIHHNKIITWSDDNTLRMWDMASGTCLLVLEGHSDFIRDALIHENNIISISQDRSLRIWDMNSGHCLHILKGHSDYIAYAIIKEEKIISWSGDKTLRIWDIPSGKCLNVLSGHSDIVWDALTYQNRIISWSNDNTLRIWDIASGKSLHVLEGHSERIYGALVHDNKIISWSSDQTVRIWEIDLGSCLHVLNDDSGVVFDLLVYKDKIIGGAERGVFIWSASNGSVLKKILSKFPVSNIFIENNLLFVSYGRGSITIFDLDSYCTLASYYADAEISTFHINKKLQRIIVGDDSGRMHFLQPAGFEF